MLFFEVIKGISWSSSSSFSSLFSVSFWTKLTISLSVRFSSVEISSSITWKKFLILSSPSKSSREFSNSSSISWTSSLSVSLSFNERIPVLIQQFCMVFWLTLFHASATKSIASLIFILFL